MSVIDPVQRELPDTESQQLVEVVRSIRAQVLDHKVSEAERSSTFPRDVFRQLGEIGLLGMPYPTEFGGAQLPYTVYLQVLEELAASWLAVGLGVSVHTLSAHPIATRGTDKQQEELLPEMLGGQQLGAYCLSEVDAGSDAAALTTKATKTSTGWVLNGTKAWITHGSQADYYTVMARTSPDGSRGISCFHVPADCVGLSFGTPERKLGMRASTTAQVILTDVELGDDALIGEPGSGFSIAMAALDSGRLGIAACAVGVAQAALSAALEYCRTRQQFDQPIGDFQGVRFMLADMATGVASARALYLSAARLRDQGSPYSMQAAMAKLSATDMCMAVTTDAVQLFGGAGYVEDHPVERLFREAKVLQIVEGTNQIQRHVIGNHLMR